MWEILRVNPRAFYWSLGLHLFFALLFFVGIDVLKPALDAGSKARVVQASLVSDRALEALVSDLETGAAGSAEGSMPETDTGIEMPVPDLPEPELPASDSTEAERPTRPELQPPEPDPAELEAQRLAAEEEARRAAELAAQREAQEAARREAEEAARREALELEAQRQAELEAQRLAAEKAARREALELEAQRQAELEAQRLAAEQAAQARRRAEQEAERRRIAEAEARARAEEEARRMEAERERLRQEAERLAAEEAARLEAELERERRQQLAEEAKRLAQEEERRLAEEMLQLQLAEEESRVNDDRADKAPITETTKAYGEMIGLHVQQYWIRPTELNRDMTSEALVLVRLTQSGDVIDARIIQSNGSALFEQSVLAAVDKASPFPVPDGPEFENFRQFRFKFRPGDNAR